MATVRNLDAEQRACVKQFGKLESTAERIVVGEDKTLGTDQVTNRDDGTLTTETGIWDSTVPDVEHITKTKPLAALKSEPTRLFSGVNSLDCIKEVTAEQYFIDEKFGTII